MKLFAHQKQGIEIGKQGSHAFFWECGTGKSCLGLNIIKYWKQPALVVCPLSIIEAAWIEDCKKFTPELDIVSLWNKKPAERKKRLAENHDIYVANYETFKYLFKDIQAKQFGVIIVDESSKMKSPASQITRALLSLAGIKTRGKNGVTFPVGNVIPHRYILSGTPAPNDESEYWSQVKFVTGSGNHVFNDNFYAFRNRYFYSIPLGRTGQKIFKFRRQSQQEFTDKLSEISHVVRKQDALDLPEQIHEIRNVILSKPEQAAYNTLKNDLVLKFADETILATNALVEVLLLRELTSGFCYIQKDNGQKETHQIGKSKLNELKALLEEIGNNQVIIWANFKHEIATLLKELPNSDALWSKSIDRNATIKNFKSGKIKYLIANPQSGAHGLSFNNCCYNVYFSLNYSYELFQQSQNRTHGLNRGIKDVSTTYYYLIGRGTIDEVIYKTLLSKGDMSNEILSFLKKNN